MYDKNLIPAATQIEIFPGYIATKLEEPNDQPSYAYEVKGPKGTWRLMRNMKSPSLMFVVSPNHRASSWKIRGWRWFTERQDTREIRTASVS